MPSTAKPAATEMKPPRPPFDAPNFTLVLLQARTSAGAGRPPRIFPSTPGRVSTWR